MTASARSGALPPQAGASLVGSARVIDGDTLVINEVHIRLEGIDAPESGQTCGRPWFGTWACGAAATSHLAAVVRDRVVRCDSVGTDVYGRMLGVCYVDAGRTAHLGSASDGSMPSHLGVGDDVSSYSRSGAGADARVELNADMVRNGFAWAFVKYSTRLVEAEAGARALRLGIWQGPATPAWAWRAERWATAAAGAEAPRGCVIKGNITRNGHIYHMPWSPWYGRTRVEPARGERWFCSEAEAMAAGWRPAMAR